MSDARRPTRVHRGRESGFTLVELLVGLVLGLFLLGGIITIFTGSRQSYRVNENMARVQENARFSFEVLMREIREAGSVPCGSRLVANVVAAPGALPWWADWDAGTVVGFDGAQAAAAKATGTGTADRVAGTDALLVMRMASDESAVQAASAHDAAARTLTVASAAGFGAGDVVSVCDNQSAVLMKIDSAAGTSIGYGSAGNCSTNLGYPTAACNASTPAKTFAAGGMVARFDPAFWYIGVNPEGGRSLYRVQLTKAGGAPTTVAQEMVPNVQDMQVQYLVRDSGSGNALATSWVSAADATFTGGGGWTPANPKQAVAVRITLTLRSDESVGTDGNPLQRDFVAIASLRSRELP